MSTNKITITLPDGSKMKVDGGATILDVAERIGAGLAKAAIAGKIDNVLTDLDAKIQKDAKIEIITLKSEEALDILRHTASHVMAQAVLRLFPNAKPTIGPSIENGFYYDFDTDKPFTEDDLEKIEKEMNKIIKENIPIKKLEMPKKDALAYYKNNPYKKELISDLEDKKISFYKQGDFQDLCRGPHMPGTGYIKAFRLMKVAGAYWRGDEKNRMLSRIYGTAFQSRKELDNYLHLLEEAEKRDHRKIGKEMDLFSFHDEGAGFPFFHNNGMIIKNELIKFWREEHRKMNYQEIQTPIILNKRLWVQSGHWDHYKENMYFTKIDDVDYAIKPMNCPGGMLIYNEKVHSYKELPLRIGEFGMVHRHELSGVLAGLFRVRVFTQDDAHIFMMPSQIKDEIIGVIELVDKIYRKFGLEYFVELSTRPQNSMGSDEAWETATKALEDALKAKKMKYRINEGDGAFYGPKIDFHIKDCLGRTWQCGTIQLDFTMPEKFNLEYVGEDNTKHRPVLLHRVVYGALERFIGILIEHYAGKFPLWLSPVQVKIIPIADRHKPYAEKITGKLKASGFRVESDCRQEKVEHKIRDAQLEKINYMIVVGDREIEKNRITSRTRDGKVTFNVNPDKFIEDLQKEIESKK
ncbi:MAG: threonine--tRNA ligase [archaeon]|nr:threonine--tRNA ligase [archaeon]